MLNLYLIHRRDLLNFKKCELFLPFFTLLWRRTWNRFSLFCDRNFYFQAIDSDKTTAQTRWQTITIHEMHKLKDTTTFTMDIGLQNGFYRCFQSFTVFNRFLPRFKSDILCKFTIIIKRIVVVYYIISNHLTICWTFQWLGKWNQ